LKLSQTELNQLRNKLSAERCKRSFYHFLQSFWAVIIDDDPIYNWHMEYLCDELQQIAEQVEQGLPKLHDVIINIPPGTSKSTICTVMFPVWCWVRKPSLKFITGSYSSDLSTDHAVKSRQIVRSDMFRELFPEVHIKADVDGKTHYETTANGSRSSTSVGGTITGKHGHIIIIDDPLNPKQAASDKERDTANRWFDTTLSSRKVDKAVTPTILIMQRLHEQDCTGHLLGKGKAMHHINLPAEVNDKVKPKALRANYQGGLLDPVRMGRAVLQEAKTDLGSYGYAGQYDQSPSPGAGGLLKCEWFRMYRPEDLPDGVVWNFVIDPAYTKDDTNDPSALLAYCYHDNSFYIRAVESVHLEFPDLIKHIPEFVDKHGYTSRSKVFVEPKASGKSIVQTLKRGTSINIKESKPPTKDKIARVKDIAPVVECGRVHVLPGMDSFLDQCAMFPNAAHDDEVDDLVIMINEHTAKPKSKLLLSAQI